MAEIKLEKDITLKGIKVGDIRHWGKPNPQEAGKYTIDTRTLLLLSNHVPSRKVFEPADECIYCGAKENLSTEHIIPYSLGGRFELPSASCAVCQAATKKLEGKVCRGQLHVPRSVSGIQTRRKKDRVTTVPIELHYFKTNRKKKYLVDVDSAPLINIIPIFEQVEDAKHGEYFLSKCTLKVVHHVSFEERHRRLIERTRANQISYTSPGIQVETFVAVLWKIAAGFFWLVARKSLLASGRNRTVNGGGPPVYVADHNINKENRQPLMLFTDIRTIGIAPNPNRYGFARVFSEMRGSRKWLVCEIDILSILGFPNYWLSIPCIEDEFKDTHFTLDL